MYGSTGILQAVGALMKGTNYKLTLNLGRLPHLGQGGGISYSLQRCPEVEVGGDRCFPFALSEFTHGLEEGCVSSHGSEELEVSSIVHFHSGLCQLLAHSRRTLLPPAPRSFVELSLWQNHPPHTHAGSLLPTAQGAEGAVPTRLCGNRKHPPLLFGLSLF